jgi:hypothetical protein
MASHPRTPLAAVLPARRATRLDILDSIAADG